APSNDAFTRGRFEGDAVTGEGRGEVVESPREVLLGAGRPQPGEGRQTSEGGTAYLPLYLAVLPLPAGGPWGPVAAGYEYLGGYTRRAIRVAERRAGPLSDHEDLIQQVCLEWLEEAGPPQEAFPRLLERAPAEMRLLRDAVNRVIARTI